MHIFPEFVHRMWELVIQAWKSEYEWIFVACDTLGSRYTDMAALLVVKQGGQETSTSN